MTDPIDQNSGPQDERKRIIAGRNRALGLLLTFLVVLFFAITIVKMKL